MQAEVEAFIARWQGQERANYALFLTELTDLLDLPYPDPASATTEGNDYVFERVVKEVARDGSTSHKGIELVEKLAAKR
ncbi:MAG TPA: hypothetical protein VGO22_05940 [Pseudorhizobium sp.]|nr:hypothetical protein [Pseudorhizobium sp.]